MIRLSDCDDCRDVFHCKICVGLMVTVKRYLPFPVMSPCLTVLCPRVCTLCYPSVRLSLTCCTLPPLTMRAKTIPSLLPPSPLRPRVSCYRCCCSAAVVDLPEVTGQHRKFRTLVSSYIGTSSFSSMPSSGTSCSSYLLLAPPLLPLLFSRGQFFSCFLHIVCTSLLH